MVYKVRNQIEVENNILKILKITLNNNRIYNFQEKIQNKINNNQ